MRRFLGTATLAVVLMLVATTGCSMLSARYSCPARPGEDCNATWQGVYDDLAEVPGVTGVVEVRHTVDFERGPTDFAEVLTDGHDEAAFARLAQTLATTYFDRGDLDYGTVDISIVPTALPPLPSRAENLVQIRRTRAEMPCAADECAQQVTRFQEGWDASAVAAGITLAEITWRARRKPNTVAIFRAQHPLMPRQADRMTPHLLGKLRTGMEGVGTVGLVLEYPSAGRTFTFRREADGQRRDVPIDPS